MADVVGVTERTLCFGITIYRRSPTLARPCAASEDDGVFPMGGEDLLESSWIVDAGGSHVVTAPSNLALLVVVTTDEEEAVILVEVIKEVSPDFGMRGNLGGDAGEVFLDSEELLPIEPIVAMDEGEMTVESPFLSCWQF